MTSAKHRNVIFFVALVAVAVVMFLAYTTQRSLQEGLLRVTFLDVGQGDAIFIESPTNTQMLIDGGFDRSVLRRLGARMSVTDRTLDVVLATHPDADHIGGLISVLERYDVEHIFHSGVLTDTPAYENFERNRKGSSGVSRISERDTVIDLGGGAYVRILFPDRRLSEHTETNQASAIVEVVYGDVEFLLTGDAPQSTENYVASLEGLGIQSEVLKAGHHGSRTSSSGSFVDAVHPSHVVVSAGKDNRYGHPHKEVVDRFMGIGASILTTYDHGDVVFETDGKTLWLGQ